MNKIILTFFILFLFHFTPKAQFNIGHTTITFNDPSRSGGFGSGGGPGRQIQTEIYYPANLTGTNVSVANGSFPVICFGHGFVMTWDVYNNIWEYLVPQGFIVAFPRTEGSIAPSHDNFAADLNIVLARMQNENVNSASLFYQKVGPKNVLMGHSMGGGAAIIAASTANLSETVIGLAPAETNPSAISAALNVSEDALILSGSSDAVTAPNTNHEPIYNNLISSCKHYVSITNGSHCYFANSSFTCDLGEFFPGSLSRSEQQDITQNLVLNWLDFKVKSNCTSFLAFQDSISTSPRTNTMTSCSYQVTIVDSSEITAILCPNDSFTTINGSIVTTNAILVDTLYNEFGCDSFYFQYTITLTQTDSTFELLQSCNPSDTGLTSMVFMNQNGCDSSHTTQVDLSNFSTSNQNLWECDSLFFMNQWIDSSVILYDTLSGASSSGCDSVVVYNVFIDHPVVIEIDSTICEGDSLMGPDGVYLYDAGFYEFDIIGQLICPRKYFVTLSVEPQILVDAIVGSDTVYVGDTSIYFLPNFELGNPIFIDVFGGNLLADNADDSLTVLWLNEGDFAIGVTIFNDYCSKILSKDVTVLDSTSTSLYEINSRFSIYPNPVSDILFFDNIQELRVLKIMNYTGQVVYSQSFSEQINGIDVSQLHPGFYILQVNNQLFHLIKE